MSKKHQTPVDNSVNLDYDEIIETPIENENKKVVGYDEAVELQKKGWVVISAYHTKDGKEFVLIK